MLKPKNRGVVIRVLLAACAVLAGYTPTVFARHGEANFLPNRIPEPAAYEYSETIGGGGQTQNPPFENLWTTKDDVGSCSGCHTGLYDQWNGSMMANAWRDPGWRGAFLLVARLTSTDGCNDITPALDANGNARDGSAGFDCSTATRKLNPFAGTKGTTAAGTSTFYIEGTGTATYSGASNSGSLMDDFCSRCHMPTNYVDATVSVGPDAPSGQEHGLISLTYDPTSVAPGSLALNDPAIAAFPAYGSAREAFGTRLDGTRPVNSNSGKIGIVCEVCHTNVASRYTPYHNYNKVSGTNVSDYYAATKSVSRADDTQLDQFGQVLLPQGTAAADPNTAHEDMIYPPEPNSKNLGYAVGAGAFRLSPHALAKPERFGPLSWRDFTSTLDQYMTEVFTGGTRAATGGPTDPAATNIYYYRANPPGKHETYYQAKFERAEFCASCHDVTNPLTIKNAASNGKWAGGFPIERTYTEFLSSRYADRPGNANFDANYKRDCQTCHMQQTFGEPGTALTLYTVTGTPAAPIVTPDAPIPEPSCDRVQHVTGFSHHFVGGNAYITKMIGADVNGGTVQPYPELLETSFSSAEPTSRFNYARFTPTGTTTNAVATQHQRFAWDRLRNALTMKLVVPTSAVRPAAGITANVLIPEIAVFNEGAGHNFPTGFPEGRAAWVAVHAYDATGRELPILDSARATTLATADFPNPSPKGIGYLVEREGLFDPNYQTPVNTVNCNWPVPPGGIDPYAITLRAVASKDGVCPTLDLPYATPLNIVPDASGAPTGKNAAGVVVTVNRTNPTALPTYLDGTTVNGVVRPANGDFFDDAYLKDTRLQPMKGAGNLYKTATSNNPYAEAHMTNRYSVVIDSTTVGPVAVSATVYYQSFEAEVALKFLGNLANLDDADTDEGFPGGSPKLEPCVLAGACDRINDANGTVIKRETEVRNALKFDPVVIEGAPPVPVIVKSAAIQLTGTGTTPDTTRPTLVINNSTANPNTTALIPRNRHWSPSPYGGTLGNYRNPAVNVTEDSIGEQNVDPARIVKMTFSEPVQECRTVSGATTCGPLTLQTFYIADRNGVSSPALLDQIDTTTWALFPYTTTNQTFLSASINVIHVVPTKTVTETIGVTPTLVTYQIRDAAGNILPSNAASADGQYTFGFKIM